MHDYVLTSETPATVTETGLKTFTCSRCGKVKTEVIPKLAPAIIEGQNGGWKQGENSTLTFRSNASFSDFMNVLVDGSIVDPKHYDLSEGSIIVTLKADYLAALSPGTHTLVIQSDSGNASTEFFIEEAAPQPGTMLT